MIDFKDQQASDILPPVTHILPPVAHVFQHCNPLSIREAVTAAMAITATDSLHPTFHSLLMFKSITLL